MKTPIFPRHVGMQTFLLLLCGILLIQVSSLVVFNSYRTLSRINPSREQISHKLLHLVEVTENLGQRDIERLLRAAEDKETTLLLTTVAPTDRTLIKAPTLKKIQRLLDTEKDEDVNFSLQLADNLWLNVIIDRLQPKGWRLTSYVIALSITLLGALALCFWALRRLTSPLVNFALAAKRLGCDVNAPPLPETGPVEFQAIVHTFNEMQARIRQLISGRTQFLAAISHDLRTPITRLKLRAEYILDPKNQVKVKRDLDEMTTMIDSTLSFARNTHLEEAPTWFDLEALLEALCDDLVVTGYEVDFTSELDRLRFYGRNLALKRTFVNLIENAVKYGNRARVQLNLQDKHVMIHIDDDGPGIPEAEQEKVFEPFYRVDNSRSQETGGTGLGLAIARDVILSLGGEIQLINRQGGGLRVILTLPISA